MDNRYFSNGGAYRCRICNKRTRETGYEESSVELCAKCLLECYVENAQSDYGTDSSEAREAQARLDHWKSEHKG